MNEPTRTGRSGPRNPVVRAGGTPRRPGAGLVATVLTLSALLGGGLAVTADRVHPARPPTTATPAATPTPSSETPETTTPSAPPSPPPDTDPPAMTSDNPSAPTRIAIPSIGVQAAVISLGLEQNGTLQVPPVEDDDPAGWYDGSPVPGTVGPAVIVGHTTVGAYGNGVFHRLGELKPGDQIIVDKADGRSASFTVRRIELYPREQFPTSEVYGDTAGPALRLVTCAGTQSDRGYSESLVVYADLTS